MWQQLARPTRRLTHINTYNKMGYPTPLKEKNQEQITNVYSKLIFPGQYIPHLYTDTNSSQIQLCGQHISEIPLNKNNYTRTHQNSVPQHCRYYNGTCLIFYNIETWPFWQVVTASSFKNRRQRTT